MPIRWFLLCFVLITGQPEMVLAEPPTSSCAEEAVAWVSALGNGVDRDLLQRHTAASCSFSGKWVAEDAEVVDEGRRRRLCNDLVLLWNYKKCVYFRDYVSATSYQPCMTWVRTMFAQCMANQVDWFVDVPGASGQVR